MTRPQVLRIRTPEDVLALVPCVLGFHPEESLVLLTFGPRPSFHARIDLPANDLDRSRAALVMLEAVGRNRVDSVIPVCYATDPERARLMVAELERGLAAVGVTVLSPLRVADGAWFELSARHAAVHGHPLDLGGHPFLAQSVLDGRVMHASRAELVASLRTDPAIADEVLAQVRARAAEPPAAQQARQIAQRHLVSGSVPSPPELADLVVGLDSEQGRRELRRLLLAHPPSAHLRLWPAVVRAAPPRWEIEPLAVLGLAAWLGGDGALGWCVADRLAESAPGHPVLRFLQVHLEKAVAPGRRSLEALVGWGEAANR